MAAPRLQLAFARLRRDRGAMISLGVIIVIILVAIFAPLFAKITGHGPNEQYYTADAKDPASGLPAGPNAHFWFGADGLGRDVLVRVAYGARVSLEIGLGATALTIVIGVVMGLLAGYFGGMDRHRHRAHHRRLAGDSLPAVRDRPDRGARPCRARPADRDHRDFRLGDR